MYGIAEEYYKNCGDLEVPGQYITPDGYALGAWLNTQRKVYAGKAAGNLTKEQEERLTTIGMEQMNLPGKRIMRRLKNILESTEI